MPIEYPPKQPHQYFLDSLRGIATLIVVMTHYVGAFFPYAAFGHQARYQQHFEWESLFFYPPFGLLIAGHFAVCLFFILSGYVLSYRYLGEPNNRLNLLVAMLKRPIRLGGVVAFTLLLSACLWHKELYLNQAVTNITSSDPWFFDLWKGHFYLKDFLINITQNLFSHAETYNISMWTIKTELYGSVLVFILLFLVGNFKYRAILFVLVALFLMKSFYQGFILGMLIADTIKHEPFVVSKKKTFYLNFCAGLTFLYFSSYPHYARPEFIEHTLYALLPHDNGFEGGYPMLAALLFFCLACFNHQFKTCLEHNALKFIGKISYGIYGIHILVIGSFSAWLFLSLYHAIGYLGAFVFTFFLSSFIILLSGYFITHYIDNPAIKLSNFISKWSLNFLKSSCRKLALI